MRTTLIIDDDVLSEAKALARHKKKSVGAVISDLARQGMTPQFTTKNGIPQLPLTMNSKPVTMELVNQLREELDV